MRFSLGSNAHSVDVRITDDSGLPVTELLAATFPAVSYSLAGPNADFAFPTLSDLGALTSAWVAGGVKERGGGVYRLDLPDAVFAAVGVASIRGEESNKRLLAPYFEIVLTDGAGTGANSVAITVNDGTSSLQNALVRVTNGAESYVWPTNEFGVVTFNLDDANWSLGITKPGFQFAPVTLIVNGAEAATYAMMAVTITPSASDRTTCYLTVQTIAGVAVSGINVTLEYRNFREDGRGEGVTPYRSIRATNASGYVEFANFHRLAGYRVKVGEGKFVSGITLDAATTPLVNATGVVV